MKRKPPVNIVETTCTDHADPYWKCTKYSGRVIYIPESKLAIPAHMQYGDVRAAGHPITNKLQDIADCMFKQAEIVPMIQSIGGAN